MQRFFPVLLLLATLPASVAAETAILVGPVEIVGYGIFNPRYTGDQSGATNDRIAIDGVEGGAFAEFTTDVTAEDSRVFGIQYVINSAPMGGRFPVTQVIEIPDEGIRTPNGRTYKRMVDKATVIIGKKVFFGYGFDFPWEKVPGEWSFQIWHQNYKLAERKFTVTLPEPETADADSQ